eukprot:672590-Alexandrium_andersonii.AAC.1
MRVARVARVMPASSPLRVVCGAGDALRSMQCGQSGQRVQCEWCSQGCRHKALWRALQEVLA